MINMPEVGLQFLHYLLWSREPRWFGYFWFEKWYPKVCFEHQNIYVQYSGSELKAEHGRTLFMFCVVLCCVVFVGVVLCYVVLCCVASCFVVLYFMCVVLWCFTLYCTVFCCVVLYFVVLYCVVLYCVVLYCVVF